MAINSDEAPQIFAHSVSHYAVIVVMHNLTSQGAATKFKPHWQRNPSFE
jgi:hypothetical protein